MVVLTTDNAVYPYANPSQGVGVCVGFKLTPGDIFTGTLVKAKIVFTVSAGAATGSFDLEGKTFTIDNAQDYTASKFKVDADIEQTARNIRDMLMSNQVILNNWDVVLKDTGGSFDQVELTPKKWNYKPSGTAANNMTGGYIAMNITNYNDVKLKGGIVVMWQLYENGLNGKSEVMAKNGMSPLVDSKTGDVLPIKVSINDIVTRSLKTTFPYRNYKSLQYDYTILNRYNIRFGHIQRNGCNDVDILTAQSDDVIVVNSRISKNSLLGFNEFCYDTAIPTRKAKFLNISPTRTQYTKAVAYHWLWYYDMVPAQATPTRQFVLYSFYDSAGAAITTSEVDYPDVGVYPNTSDGIGVLVIPCGFGNCPVTVPGNAASLRVSVRYEDGGVVQATQSVTFILRDSCGGYEFYFLSSLGGYDTIHFDKVEDVSFSVNQENIDRNKSCRNYNGVSGAEPNENNINDYLRFLNSSGRKQTNTSEIKEYRVTSRKVRPESEESNYFEEFLKSESRKMRIDRGGYAADTDYAYCENIILSHSEVITYRDEGMVQYQFTFQFANKNGAVSEY